jgi:hypothetical protein
MKRLTSPEAADHIGTSMRVLKELREARKIAFYKIGHRTVSYSMADLDRFLERCRIAPAGEKIGAAQ